TLPSVWRPRSALTATRETSTTAVWRFTLSAAASSFPNCPDGCGRVRAWQTCAALKNRKPTCNNTIPFTLNPDDRLRQSQESHPRSPRFPQTRHPFLRHHHHAEG